MDGLFNGYMKWGLLLRQRLGNNPYYFIVDKLDYFFFTTFLIGFVISLGCIFTIALRCLIVQQ